MGSSTASVWTEPPDDAIELGFGSRNTAVLRRVVTAQGREAGFDHERVESMIAAVNEIASNSIRHAGGRGSLRTWHDPAALTFEVRDSGRLEDPEGAGRVQPPVGQIGGYGLYLARQLADEMQVRSDGGGTAVRLRFSR